MRTGLAAVLVLALTTSAGAQPRDVQRADALFREGRAAMKAGDVATACLKLQGSYDLDPAAGTAVNLGDCFDKQGRVGSALLAYRAARKLLKTGDPRIVPVEKQIASLEQRAPRLTITLPSDAPEGTVVKRDDHRIDFADFGRPLLVNPGVTTILVSAPGHESVRSRLTLTERQRRTFVAEVGEPTASEPHEPSTHRTPASPTRPEPRDEGSGSASRATGSVLAGIGIAGLGTGIVAGLMADAKLSTVESNCPKKNECNQAGYDAAQSGRTLDTVSLVGWGVGLVGIAAGSYFLFFDDADKEQTTSVSAKVQPKSATVTVRGGFW